MAEYENSNLDCIRTILIMFELFPRHLMLFWKLCPLVFDDRGEVYLSLQSVPAQNDG